MENKKNDNKLRLVLILLLLILIIIIIYFIRFETVMDNDTLIPTGNVNVFDIDVNCKCSGGNCIITDKNNNIIKKINIFDNKVIKKIINTEPKSSSNVVAPEDELLDGDVDGEVFVDDTSGNYLYLQKLDIFNNSAYQFTNKIAPGVSNVYQFVIHNSTDAKIRYKVEMLEQSSHKINLVYRLKKNNQYVVGNSVKWVSANDLKTEFQKLNSSISDNYSLEWKWLYEGDDYSDTLAGKNMDDEYKLNIKVYFEAIK